MKNTFTIKINKGTKVLAKTKTSNWIVELKGDVVIDDATRHEDGGFGYCIGLTCYKVSAGTCNFSAN